MYTCNRHHLPVLVITLVRCSRPDSVIIDYTCEGEYNDNDYIGLLGFFFLTFALLTIIIVSPERYSLEYLVSYSHHTLAILLYTAVRENVADIT